MVGPSGDVIRRLAELVAGSERLADDRGSSSGGRGQRRRPEQTTGARGRRTRGRTMPLYLSRFSYTAETWAKLIDNPEDRKGRPVLYRVGRWEAPRVLVRLGHTRRLQPLGGPGRRLDGRGCAGDQRGRCAWFVRN